MNEERVVSSRSGRAGSPKTCLAREDVHFRFRPHVHEYLCPAEPTRAELGSHSVFAGGGITNCPDWQVKLADLVNEELLKLLKHRAAARDTIVGIANPRRTHFPIGDPNASPFQIGWEHRYLQQVKAISMWFPNSSEGPISLFETGRWMMSSKPLFLGIEPGYSRTEELLAHVHAVRPRLQVVESLERHAKNVALWALGIGRVDLPVLNQNVRERTLYLVGGMKGCPDWQAVLSDLLKGSKVEVENRRKNDFVRGTAEQYRQSVRENRLRLDSCEAAAVWFPKEQITPVALLELGSLVASPKPVFIGVDPGYRRQIDVEIQTALARPEIEVVHSLDELADQVRRYYSMR